MTTETDLKYPVGKFDGKTTLTDAERRQKIEILIATPAWLRAAVDSLNDKQLDTPYREGGWTVRQTVHHVTDSHMNAYMRTKLALTEDNPTIKPYLEARWAELADSREPLDGPLDLLELLHQKWIKLLRSMSAQDFARTFRHPETPDQPRTLDSLLGIYAWHGPHHCAHITRLRERMGW